MSTLRTAYRQILESWVSSALPFIHTPSDRADLDCYGTGYNSWGVQTNQKAFAAFAVLAAEPDLDEVRLGLSRDDLAEHALRLLRFSLESHHAGSYHCTDGESWGHTWISALGIERMMHGVDDIESLLTDKDRELLRRVLLSECDWLVDGYRRSDREVPGTVKAGLTVNNDPESNLWNGALLCRTAMMYPDCPRREDYLEQGQIFLLAGISLESDAESEEVVDGVCVGDRFLGANFFDSFALNHHAYLNVGYMVICLSQVAMAHFAWRRRGQTAPEALYRNIEGLWRVVRQLTFPDGRLGRIGGATRARYCYCQDYAVPTWLLMRDLDLDTETEQFEESWLEILRTEIAAGDGRSFLSARLSEMAQISPTYYSRLESDRACALSMALSWRNHHENEWNAAAGGTNSPENTADASGPVPTLEKPFGWSDDYHGATFVRGPNRFASWVWRSAELPQGLCVPSDKSDMAEWRWNLAGRFLGVGRRNVCRLVSHGHEMFDGGFLNSGVLALRSEGNLAEGEGDKEIATEVIAVAALPDDTTILVIQYAVAANRAFLRSAKGIHLLVPNDVFNQRRTYRTAAGELVLAGATRTGAPADTGQRRDSQLSVSSQGEMVLDLASDWVTVDDVLTVRTTDGSLLSLVRPSERQVTIRDKPFDLGSLYADEICAQVQTSTTSYQNGEPIVDLGFTVGVGGCSSESGEGRTPGGQSIHGDGYRGIVASGVDGCRYCLVVALDVGEKSVRLPESAGGGRLSAALDVGQAVLYQLEPLPGGAAGQSDSEEAFPKSLGNTAIGWKTE